MIKGKINLKGKTVGFEEGATDTGDLTTCKHNALGVMILPQANYGGSGTTHVTARWNFRVNYYDS